jgi:hypothetical protein
MSLTSRSLPTKRADAFSLDFSATPYGDVRVVNPLSGLQQACDEGAYFTAVNATSETGISASIATAYSATASAYVALRNTDANSDASSGKRIFLDYIKMRCTVAPASATRWLGVIDIDSVLTRFTSGGTPITPANSNMAVNSTSIAAVNVGALTTVALSSAGRTVSRISFRTVIPVVGDTYIITFGGVDKPTGAGVVNGTNPQIITYNAPPVVLPANGVMCLSVFGASNAATGWAGEFEMGWLER